MDPMLSASGNLFKCHEEVLYLQPLIPPKRFDITGGCSEGLGVFRFFFKLARGHKYVRRSTGGIMV